ncbi:patellin-3 [Beta vulgaris subsp. vulgaris]|uniref:patellin-3 n=1 Tax=Beta vulgaris subsp. vulgaris TaxID=3555 RepID=UPI002037094F|nr:patellin-3 [Beta vulgaris subsp. vulgaris]
MAEETHKPESTVAEVVVPVAEKPAEKPAEKAVLPPEAEKLAAAESAEAEKPADSAEAKIAQQVSFKEETNVASELPELHRKALEDLKKLIQEALEKHEFSSPPPPPPPAPAKVEEKAEEKKEEQPPSTTSTTTTTTTAVSDEVAVAPPSEEAPKTDEASPKVEEEPAKIVEQPPTTPAEEPEPAKTPEVVVAEEEKTVEDIKETIVVEVATTTAAPVLTEPESVEETPKEAEVVVEESPKEPEEVSIWGIPLLADERSDVILLKFLRARDYRVKDAFTMIRNTARWRKEFEVDSLLDEDLGNDYEKVVFTHGVDKQGRPVCYNVFGEFQNKELYQNTFSDAEKRKKFLRWLIQFLEKTIRTLDFSPEGINSFVLVNDLKNSPGYGKRDLYKVIDKFLEILQDNYPEFAAKQLCINVSWWYLAYNWIYLTVFTPRSKSKFVFASPSKTAETLFKYIAPEQVPVQFGGHSKFGEHEFSPADTVTEVTIKPGSKHPIEFAFSEETELVWELRVIGWDVSYGAEFLPTKEGGYTLNIAKPKKVTPADEPVICDTFKVTEPGKVVITIDNQSSKKKKLLYRSKVKTSQ